MLAKKVKRDHTSDHRLDELERQWWDANAATVAQVWQMHDEVSSTVRRAYLKRARRFLRGSRSGVTVLELGCGSGWVGQMIAGPGFQVLGTDFSASQVRLAVENAKARKIDAYCKYLLATTTEEWMRLLAQVDGVLIHCFLHHLSGEEIGRVLGVLRDNLRRDGRVWIYEPAFYLLDKHSRSRLRIAPRVSLKIASSLVAILDGLYTKLGLLDEPVAEAFARLSGQAAESGWYLSPKEIPLGFHEFSNELQEHLRIVDGYWATIHLVGWVYRSNLLRSVTLRRVVNRLVLPFLALADKAVSKEHTYLEGELAAPNYGFHVWECTKQP